MDFLSANCVAIMLSCYKLVNVNWEIVFIHKHQCSYLNVLFNVFFLQVVSFFEGLGFDKESVGGILGRCPEIFCSSIKDTLGKKIRFLAAIGVSRAHIPRVIKKYPELLVCDTDRTLLPR